jgi:hypothetical protein
MGRCRRRGTSAAMKRRLPRTRSTSVNDRLSSIPWRRSSLVFTVVDLHAVSKKKKANHCQWQGLSEPVPFDLLCTGDVLKGFMFIHMPNRQPWACKALPPKINHDMLVDVQYYMVDFICEVFLARLLFHVYSFQRGHHMTKL